MGYVINEFWIWEVFNKTTVKCAISYNDDLFYRIISYSRINLCMRIRVCVCVYVRAPVWFNEQLRYVASIELVLQIFDQCYFIAIYSLWNYSWIDWKIVIKEKMKHLPIHQPHPLRLQSSVFVITVRVIVEILNLMRLIVRYKLRWHQDQHLVVVNLVVVVKNWAVSQLTNRCNVNILYRRSIHI